MKQKSVTFTYMCRVHGVVTLQVRVSPILLICQ